MFDDLLEELDRDRSAPFTQFARLVVADLPLDDLDAAAASDTIQWMRDLFAALGDDLGQGRWSLRLQYKPLIRYVWLGAILIALGGAIAAFDRRYRVRAPAAAAERVAAAAS